MLLHGGSMLNKILLLILTIVTSASFVFAEKGSLKIGIMPAPPNISAGVKFAEPSGNNILDAEETGTLTITINNTGKGDAFDVTAGIRSDGVPCYARSIHDVEQTPVIQRKYQGRVLVKYEEK